MRSRSNREEREHLAGEHALTDRGQAVLLAIFLATPVVDSFVLRGTTVLASAHMKLFPALEFPVQLLKHLPDARAQGTWMRKPHFLHVVSRGWMQQHVQQPALRLGGTH